MRHFYKLQPPLSEFLPSNGRWGRDTNANRKEKEKSRNKSRLRRVRFKDTSGSSVVLNKEKKRVWFSRFWFSVRRRQNKRKSSLENTFNAINTMTVEPECKFRKIEIIYRTVHYQEWKYPCDKVVKDLNFDFQGNFLARSY